MGAVLQQRVQNALQPLAFFSRNLSPAQQKYRVCDREPLAIYEAVKQFRYMLEARYFIIFTDHKPITYTFQQKRDKCSPRQSSRLHFTVHDRYPAHIRPTQRRRRRAVPRRGHLRALLTTHWPRLKTPTTKLGHSCKSKLPYG
jgi:hypothetical protein